MGPEMTKGQGAVTPNPAVPALSQCSVSGLAGMAIPESRPCSVARAAARQA